MLGKLMKHEFIATWKIFTLLNVIALIAGAVASLVVANIPDLSQAPEALLVLLGIGMFGYIFILIAVCILATVFLVVRYYRSLYSHEGYLTFTLPATTTEILSSKILVSFIWMFITAICILASLSILSLGVGVLFENCGAYSLGEFYFKAYSSFAELFGFDHTGVLFAYIADGLLSICLTLLMFFFAISLGQLWQKHKILGSIIFYFIIRFVFGISNTIASFGNGSFQLLYDTGSSEFFVHYLWISIILSTIFSIIMYVGCIFVTDRRLNLD